MHALELRIRSDAERVELARLTATLNQVRLALREIDHVYIFRGSRPKWVVDGIRDQDHLLVIRLTASGARRRDPHTLLVPAEALVSGVETLQQVAEVPQYYTEATVERLVRIGEPGQGVKEVSLATVNGRVGDFVSVSDPVRQNAREAVRPAEVSLGSVVGWLDTMSARRAEKGVLVVGLYDMLTRRAVSGYLSPRMESEVQQLWRRRVLAHGLITRNQRGQPIRIKIERFERMPEDDTQRASVSDLLGAAPGWTGGLSVDEFVREARRA